MVDEDVIKSFTQGERDGIKDAFRILSGLGVFPRQVQANVQRLVEGFNNTDPTALAKRILEVQQTNRQLLALHELATNLERYDDA